MNYQVHAKVPLLYFLRTGTYGHTQYLKLLIAMKLVTILILVSNLCVAASVLAQKVNLEVENAPFKSVLREIQRQSNYSFIIHDEYMRRAKPVSLHIKDGDIMELLPALFAGQPFAYSVNGKVVYAVDKKIKNKIFLRQDTIRGTVTDSLGHPLAGVAVRIVGTNRGTTTNSQGRFQFNEIPEGARFSFHLLGYVNRELAASPNISVQLQAALGELSEVTINTGYQTVPKERSTGSFDFVDNELFNRRVSTNILERIENLTPGILFNRGDAAATDEILIRGRSTIYADASPLIVLDNFPYDGDIRNINPNDIENITILKDAAAASIWGAQSGNGVIVITTKQGKSSKPQLEINTNTTFQQRPDLFNISTISSADYIELEKDLFGLRHYDGEVDNIFKPALTPVVELLYAKEADPSRTAEVDALIEQMKAHDVRDDYTKYLYRVGINQQHALNVSGQTPRLNYFMSTGYDRNLPTEEGNKQERISFRTRNIYQVTDRISLSASMNIAMANNVSNFGSTYPYLFSGKYMYPYARLADENGNTLPVYLNLRKSFIDEAQDAGLLNWEYNPIDNLGHETITTKQHDYTLLGGAQYKIADWLDLDVKYQYEKLIGKTNTVYDEQSYYARDMINDFTQFDWAGNLIYPVPKGGIAQLSNEDMTSHQGRIQANFNKSWKDNQHQVNAIAGWEIKSVRGTTASNQFYGYNPDKGTVAYGMDFVNYYSLYGRDFLEELISDYAYIAGTTDRFISTFANAAYTYLGRYSLSGSIRKDEANLFGVDANQKGTPLWSIGTAWNIDQEPFYNVSWLPKLKLRSTFGYQGNISRATSAYATAIYDVSYVTGLPVATIQNPPNPSLRWERTRMANLGLDFALTDQRLYGSVEYYTKKSLDLLGNAPLDPTVMGTVFYGGEPSYFGNTAEMEAKGIDINLNSRIIDRRLKWDSGFLFSYVSSKISKYLMPVSSSASAYMSPFYINPVEDRPVFSVYSYQWAGLNSENGNPQGYLNGNVSEDYSAILNNTSVDSVNYHGSSQPTIFGAFRNTFALGKLQLSFNISYKMGYYFRKESINYSNLINQWTGSGDYANRWQTLGDELVTDVPSLVYPSINGRDQFYSNVEPLVLKGDHIRLEDISASYEFNLAKAPFSKLRVYLYANNLGTLWVANADNIDPYYPNTVARAGRTFALGLNLIL